MNKLTLWKIVASLLGAVLLMLPQLSAAAEAVAMVTDLKGGARLSAQKQPGQLALLSYLEPGTEITLDAGAQIVITYFTQSAEYSFKGPARITIQPKEAKAAGVSASVRKLDTEKSGAANKLAQSGKLAFATVEMRSMVLMKPSLISPVDSKIRSRSPMFHWKELDDVENYHLMLIDDASGKVVQQADVQHNTWQLPADAALQPGAAYRWEIEAQLKTGDRLKAKGKFEVATQEAVSFADSKRPQANAGFSDQVLFALFLEAEGFNEDAKALWRELAKQHPDDPNLKRRIKE